MTGDLSLYFHVPFCSKKCPYCHFFVLPDKQALKAQFLEALKLEWKAQLPKLQGKKIVSIYLGGGTPSLLTPQELETILKLPFQDADVASDAEITLEINPENVTASFAHSLRSLPINRASLGVQSLSSSELTLLGRNHLASTAKHAIHTLYDAGLTNLSIDLMYDLPHQTLEIFHQTLEEVATLPISHLSLYNLTIEPHTPFFKRKEQLQPHLPTQELSRKLLEAALFFLPTLGLERYEISAFAKNGLISRHNTGYWTGRPFLGFGPSAFSYFEGKRFQNIPHLGKYSSALSQGESPISFEEKLEPEKALRELLAIHLRLSKGVNLELFPKEALRLLESTFNKLQMGGLLTLEGNTLRLTEEGKFFYDTVATEII